jgi:hypothetical protein
MGLEVCKNVRKLVAREVINMAFYTADLTDEELNHNRKYAQELFDRGEHYGCSQGICEQVTCGYGRLDEYGYWEYPLQVCYRVDGSSYAEPYRNVEEE